MQKGLSPIGGGVKVRECVASVLWRAILKQVFLQVEEVRRRGWGGGGEGVRSCRQIMNVISTFSLIAAGVEVARAGTEAGEGNGSSPGYL